MHTAAAAADDDDDDDAVSSSVMVNDVVFVSSMSVDWLSHTLYWVDSAKASTTLRLPFLADRTIGRAYGTVSRLSVVCLSVVCL